MATEMSSFSDEQVLMCLKMLNSDDIHSFSQDFLQDLHSRYSNASDLAKNFGNQFLLDFANHWPFFLQNDSLISELVQLCSTNLIGEQSKALKILSNKNMVNPALLRNHFDTFIKMKDKSNVKPILNNFISTCAYIGLTDGIDIARLTQTVRRIYKSPQELPTTQVLDFLVLLAVQNASYKDFDPKSKAFVEECLEYIESQF